MKAHGFRLTRKKQQRPQINLQQQIKAPQKLKLLVLSGSRLSTQDFVFIMKCRSIIKLDLSDNQLSEIPSDFNAESLPCLRLLYLHNNYLRQIEDIKPITTCQQLIHITIFNNPIQSTQIQHYFINVIPALKMINDRVVLEEEKADFIIVNREPTRIPIEDLGTLGTTQVEEQMGIPEEKKHILRLQRQLFLIKQMWVDSNPIVKFQRRWRKHHLQVIKTTKHLEDQTNENSNYRQNKKLKHCFEKWKTLFYSMKSIKQHLSEKNKTYLTKSISNYCHSIQLQKTKKAMVYCIKKINKQNIRIKHIKTICDHLRKKVTLFNSQDDFYSVSGIAETHRILFFGNQLSTLNGILEKCNLYLSKESSPEYEVMPCYDYITIRPAEDKPPYNDSLYSYFIAPSMRCIFLKRREIKDLFISKASKNLVSIRQVPYLQRLSLKMSQDEQLQSFITYQNMTKYIQSQYQQSLLQFICHDHQYFKMLLRIIYYTNINILYQDPTIPHKLFDDTSPFRFYFDKQLRRTSAAVAIQKWWRGISVMKRQRPPPAMIITYNRSATLIKHFYRNLEYEHRMAFNRRMDRYLKGLTDNFLIIEQDVYMEMIRFKGGKELYPGSKIMIGESHVRISWDYDLEVLSPHLRELFQKQPQNPNRVEREGDIYSLFHLGANVSILQLRGVKYLKFSYQNYLVARRRVAYFSLLTYSFKKNGFHIKCYQKLNLDRESMMSYYINLKDIYGIYIDRALESLPDEETALKLTNSVFAFPKRTLELNSHKEEILRTSTKLHIEFYHKTHKNQPPIKLLQELYINLNQLRMENKPKQYQLAASPSPKEIRKNSLPKPQISMQQLNFNQEQKPIQPRINKEQILVKIQTPQHLNQTSVKKDFIHSRRKMILEHKQTAIKKFRKEKSLFSEKNQQNRLEYEVKRHKATEESYLEHKQRERSLREMKKQANQFIQKGNSLIKQDVMTNLIRTNIENRINKKERAHSEKESYESNLQRRKKFASQHSQSYITQNQGNKGQKHPHRHERYKTEVSEKRRDISLPRLSEDKNSAPPMVHGVFTQEFYAIDKKIDPSAMFNF